MPRPELINLRYVSALGGFYCGVQPPLKISKHIFQNLMIVI